MSARSEDLRARQLKRDEQIRRRVESEIAKRRHRIEPPRAGAASAASNAPIFRLKPLPPLVMPADTSVLDAAQYMTAYRASCVLVLDEDHAVCGIFTGKDLAFKVVAAQIDCPVDLRRTLKVRDVMTPSPSCVQVSSSATDALNLMVSSGFRHLPIIDEHDEIAGVLDITRCFYEAMRRLEKACDSSNELHTALQNDKDPDPIQLLSFVEALREHTKGPELREVLAVDPRDPVSIDFKASVLEAAQKMHRTRATALLVTNSEQAIAGILTTKDIVLRVLAANVDPKNCSVVRVMTPNPECAAETLNIQQALRLMYDGKFLNLPVKNSNGEIYAVVDILTLTHAALEHLNDISPELELPTELEEAATAALLQEPHSAAETAYSGVSAGSTLSALTAVSDEHKGADNSADKGTGIHADMPDMEGQQESPAWNKFWMSLENEEEGDSIKVYPHGFEDLELDSRSSINESELAQFVVDRMEGLSEVGPEDSVSRLLNIEAVPLSSSTQISAASNPQGRFSFKFRAPSGRAHRVQVTDSTDVAAFRALILAKLKGEDLSSLGGEDQFAVSYIDEDKDAISITTVQDIKDAVECAQRAKSNRVEVFLHHPSSTPTVKTDAKAQPSESGVVPMLVGSAAAMVFGFMAWGRK